MKKLISTTFTAVILTFSAVGQINPNFSAGSQQDINYLSNGYLTPFADFLQSGLSSGWYQTAKVHKLGRFDVMLTPTYVVIPNEQKLFTINNDELSSLELTDGISATTPTVFGDKTEGPELVLKDDPTPGQNSKFKMPAGLGSTFTVLPIYKVSVGLFKKTELSLRYLPEITLPLEDGGKFNLMGAALKHDLTQYLPGGKIIPLDISAFFGYTTLDYTQDVDVGKGTNENQKLEISSTSFTGRLLVSKKFLFITPYVGIGYIGGETSIKMTGDYTYDVTDMQGVSLGRETITDPVNITSEGANGFVANAGVQFLIVKFLAISGDFSVSEYNTATLGLGLNVDF